MTCTCYVLYFDGVFELNRWLHHTVVVSTCSPPGSRIRGDEFYLACRGFISCLLGNTEKYLSEGTMKSLAMKLKRFLKSEDGPTAVEYAVMLSLIIVVCLTAVGSIGTKAKSTFEKVAGQLGSTGAAP